MEQHHRQLLTRAAPYLVDNLRVSTILLAELHANYVLTEDDLHEFQMPMTPSQKVEKLVLLLKSRGRNSFPVLMKFLADPKHCLGFIKDHIEQLAESSHSADHQSIAAPVAPPVQPAPPSAPPSAPPALLPATPERADRCNNPCTSVITTGVSELRLSPMPSRHGRTLFRSMAIDALPGDQSKDQSTDHLDRAGSQDVNNAPPGARDELDSRGASALSSSEVYPMDKPKRVVILNIEMKNVFHKGRDRQRYGSPKDVSTLESVFKHIAGCDVSVWTDNEPRRFGHQSMKDRIIKSLKKEAAHGADYSAFLLVAMGHGNGTGQVEASAGMHLDIARHLLAPFSGEDSPSYHNKPKMFFIQACRGNKPSEPVDIDDIPSDNGPTIHAQADILTVKSCTQSNVSLRSHETGAVFINALSTVLRERHQTRHVLDMVTEVQYMMNALEAQRIEYPPDSGCGVLCKQLPVCETTLLRKVYL